MLTTAGDCVEFLLTDVIISSSFRHVMITRLIITDHIHYTYRVLCEKFGKVHGINCE